MAERTTSKSPQIKSSQVKFPQDMPDDLRRQDPRSDRADSLPEVSTDVAHGGISRSLDGDNPQHPVHDEDLEDAGPEDFEDMIDREGTRPVDKVIPK
jgi:hypothetical protein